ncbi:MAG: hypothetical protein MIO90_01165 [Methanomassiliicoccales archaeon]|nr:hypothetical protein [Methanomassiliicoccales archaeon]
MRMLKALSLLLGGMLLFSALAFIAVPVLADGNVGGNDNGKGPLSENSGEMPTNPGQAKKDAMYQNGVDKSLMGKMNYSYGHGQGGFLFYDLDEGTGVISDYGLITSDGDKILITSITVEGFLPDDIDVHGSVAKIVDNETIAVLHDNPTGMYHLFVDDATNVTIVLAGEMVVTEEKSLNESSNLTYQLIVSDGTSRGVIASDDPFQVTENGTVIECNVTENLMVRFLPQVAHRHQWMEMALMEAVQNGKLASEITLVADGENGIYDTVSYRNDLQVQVQQVMKNKFQFSAQGQNGQGALLLVHTETKTMDMTQDQLRVRLNDQEMRHAEDPLELIYGQPDDACYAILDDGDVQQLLVYLPENTLGTVTVEGVDALSDLLSPVGLAMIAGAIGLVGLAGVVAFRKR